jgi:hypothetical protein
MSTPTDLADRGREVPELGLSELILCRLGLGEVGEDTVDVEMLQVFDQVEEVTEKLKRNAEAVHARVDLEMDRSRSASPRRDGVEGTHGRRAVNDRRQGRLHRRFLGAVCGATKDQNRRLDPRATKRNPLLNDRDPEPTDPLLNESPRDRLESVPVGVGLHGREDLHARRETVMDETGVVAESV